MLIRRGKADDKKEVVKGRIPPFAKETKKEQDFGDFDRSGASDAFGCGSVHYVCGGKYGFLYDMVILWYRGRKACAKR